MHPQVDRHQNDVYRKDVHFLSPAADSRVTRAPQLRKKESVEGVSRGQVRLLTAFHQQVHVEINNLKSKNGISYISIYKKKKFFNASNSDQHEFTCITLPTTIVKS